MSDNHQATYHAISEASAIITAVAGIAFIVSMPLMIKYRKYSYDRYSVMFIIVHSFGYLGKL